MSALSARTAWATSAELTADSATIAPGSAARSAVSQAGSRYSATVMLAAMRSRESRSRRSAVRAASSDSAASTAACAQPATSAPAGVSFEPRGDRSIRARPSCPSSSRIRALAAGWETPCSAAARPMLPVRVTLSSRSKPVRSVTRAGRGISRAYDLIADSALPELPAAGDAGSMAQTLDLPGAGTVGRAHERRPFGLFKDLERPGDVFRDLGPNWFASVMGTGIVANAAAILPLQVPGLRVFATAVWGLAAALLVALTAAFAVHWVRFPERARGHASNPVMAQFWGAPAMALLTVGAGTLVLGQGLIGPAAVGIDWVLWLAGTALGLVTAVWIPYLMMTRHDIGEGDAFGGWLMPVVPPMVSAATGALLIPHVGSAQGRLALLLACYAMFGISLFASVIIITQVWSRLVTHKPGAAVMVPTLWIVLGPLGQSVTAAGNLGSQAAHVLPEPYAAGAAVFALLYGVPTWGFAMMWLALAAAITLRTARRGLPFALTWWSFTFPVGTCVTGTIGLAARSHADVLRAGSVVLFALLLAAWLVVAARTARGAASGRLFKPMPSAAPAG
jgi:C4-dicarboxylate transporter/malic acid transport protein